ncbi:MAG: zinc ribbon domain-containing protein [Promethearchaeota archaeon]
MLSFLIFLNPSASGDSDEYDLGIDENTEITWEFSEVNEEKLEELRDEYGIDYIALDTDYEEGDEIMYKLTNYDDQEDYYKLYFDVYEEDERIGYTHARIAKDPDDLAADLFEDIGQNDFTYDFLFTLTKTNEYIQEFGSSIPEIYTLFVSVSYSSIIINSTAVGLEGVVILKYDDNGILEEFTIYYQEYLILLIELDDVSKPEIDFFLVSIIILIIIIIVGVNIVIAVVLILKHRKKREIVDKTLAPKKEVISAEVPKKAISPMIIDESPINLDDIKYCEMCGTKREVNNKFCTNCGNKF